MAKYMSPKSNKNKMPCGSVLGAMHCRNRKLHFTNKLTTNVISVTSTRAKLAKESGRLLALSAWRGAERAIFRAGKTGLRAIILRVGPAGISLVILNRHDTKIMAAAVD
jgi:hypothetical protein